MASWNTAPQFEVQGQMQWQMQVCQSVGYGGACVLTTPAKAAGIADAEGAQAAIALSLIAPELAAAGLEAGLAATITYQAANATRFAKWARTLQSVRSRYAGMSTIEVRDTVSGTQQKLITEFFGKGLPGIEKQLANLRIPNGLTRETLEAYSEIAIRGIDQGLDKGGQILRGRLQLIERALWEMQ